MHMKRYQVLTVACLLGAVPACLAGSQGRATLEGTQPGSAVSGTATLVPQGDGLHITIRVAHVSPGQHGIHFHEHGACGEAGNAAGGHYNPDQVTHGFLPTDGFLGAHAGDLGNITVGADGTGTLDLTIPGLTLQEGPHSVVGRAIIVHEKADDFGQPTGNAGARIACGIISVDSP